MNPLVSTLESLLCKYRYVDNVEVELRLGWNNKHRFCTDIGSLYYDTFLNILNRFTKSKKQESVSHVYICSAKHGSRKRKNIRVIVDNNHQVIDAHQKMKLESVDFMLYGTPFDVRISVCTETPVSIFPKKLPHHASFVRSRYRNSWEYKTWTYDLTQATSYAPDDVFKESLQSFEFELELNVKLANEQNLNSLYLAHSSILKIMDMIHEPVTKIVILKNTKFT